MGNRGNVALSDKESWNEFIKKLNDCIKNGGAYCFECGIYFNTVIEARKHDFAKHYDYALSQCGGSKQKLNKWMQLK